MEGSGDRVEDGAVQGRPGDSKAGGYFSNRDVGSFEQRSDGLDLFGGEFGWASASSTAGTRRFQTSNGALPDQITFEFGERCEDMKDHPMTMPFLWKVACQDDVHLGV